MSGAWRILGIFSRALALTVAIELPLCLLFFRKPGRLCLRAALTALLMNIVTNPILNLALLLIYQVSGGSRAAYYLSLAVGEVAVVAVEAIIMCAALGASRRRAAMASVALNSASFLLGLII